jgi:cell division protein FtsB
VDHRSLDQTNRPFVKGLLNQIAVGVFGLLALATLLLAIFNERGMLQVHDQGQKLTALEAEIQKIQAENKSLTEEIHNLRTDRTTIEKLAREELKLVKPGEVVLVTPSDSATSTPPER